MGTAGYVEDAIDLIVNSQPNIVLLDIHLSDGTGFDIIQRLFPINFKIIFMDLDIDGTGQHHKQNRNTYHGDKRNANG